MDTKTKDILALLRCIFNLLQHNVGWASVQAAQNNH